MMRKMAMICYMAGSVLFFVGTLFNWFAGD